MNTVSAIAPSPVLRRRRPLPAEPVLFAVLLAVVTLGINLSGEPAPEQRTDSKPAASQLASAR